jgi:hypothetical protein
MRIREASMGDRGSVEKLLRAAYAAHARRHGSHLGCRAGFGSPP